MGSASSGLEISNSFNAGNVSGQTADGFVGAMQAAHNSISNSVWDIETTGQSLAVGNAGSGASTNIDGATSAEMKQHSTFVDHGFDVDDEGSTGATSSADITPATLRVAAITGLHLPAPM